MVLFFKCIYDAILFYFVLRITSVKCLPLLSTHWWRRSRKLSITWRIISHGMKTIFWQMGSFNFSIDRGRWGYIFDFRYSHIKVIKPNYSWPVIRLEVFSHFRPGASHISLLIRKTQPRGWKKEQTNKHGLGSVPSARKGSLCDASVQLFVHL